MNNFRIVKNVMLGMAVLFVLWGGVSVPYIDAATPKRHDAFSFVVMGDNRPHSGAEDKFTQPPHFYRAIDEVNLLDGDFVIIVGDLILGYTGDEGVLSKMWHGFDAAVGKLAVPYYQVIGNHDVSNAVMQRVYLERYGDRFPLFYSFDHKGSHFIVLNSDLHGEYQNITGQQLAWLKKDLKRCRRAKKIFVFLHQPLWKYENSNWMREVQPLLAQYRVDTVFCGHLHQYTKYADVDGVRYIVTGGAGTSLIGTDFTGGFYHYCVVTVRDDKVSIAVVRTGYVENEEIVNEDLLGKVSTFSASLHPMGPRLERGAAKVPEQFDVVVSNPFDEKLTGTLVWEVPKGSPWRMPATEVPISVEPRKEQTLTIEVPPGGSVTDTGPLEPFPVGIWNLSVGGRTLWKNRRTEVIIDQWPYTNARTALREATSMDRAEKIVAGSEVSATLRISTKNPTEWRMQEIMSWRFPEGCRWKISPALEVIDLAPGEGCQVKFDVSFTGSPQQIFPLPRLDCKVKLDGEEVLQTWAHLPIDAREFLSKETRVGRCVRLKAGPSLDGRLNDPAWQECTALSNFILLHAAGRPEYPTEARLAYDSENLYISFRCYEPNLSGLVTKAKKHDEAAWADDSVEIFLDTNLDRKTYYQYAINANAVVYDGEGLDKNWNGPCTVKAGREEEAWTLEVAIPWRTIEMSAPEAGTRIGLELVRTHPRDPHEISQWSPTFGGNHVPSRFGVLMFE